MLKKNQRKFVVCILLTFFVIANLTGCGNTGRGSGVDNRFKVGITVYNQYDTFIASVVDEVNSYAKELEEEKNIKIQIDVVNASESQSEQNSQVEDFVNQNYDIILVNIVDRTDPSYIIETVKSANIPVIFFNRELVAEDIERWSKIFYVGAVTVEPAIMQAQIVIDAYENDLSMDKNGDGVLQYIMLEGQAGHQDSIVRTEQSIATIENEGIALEKLGYGIANWNRTQAQTKVTQLIKEYGQTIELVIANNDDMALGAIDAYESQGVKEENWPAIVGIDGTGVGIEAVKNGKMIGTVYNDAVGQAWAMVDLAYNIYTEKDIEEKYYRLPHSIITMDNVDDYLEGKIN